MAYTTHEDPYVQMGDGRQVVATAGTRVQLSSTSTKVSKAVISALPTNTNYITVGGSTVVAAAGTETGKVLYPGDSETFFVDNLTKIYIDAVVSGNGCTYIYYR